MSTTRKARVLPELANVAYLPTATNPPVKQEKRYQRYPASVVDARLEFIRPAAAVLRAALAQEDKNVAKMMDVLSPRLDVYKEKRAWWATHLDRLDSTQARLMAVLEDMKELRQAFCAARAEVRP